MFGVAPSATAAEVLSDETGLVADTLDKLLIEHRLNRPPDHRYDLPVGATLIVDEAGMMPTTKLAELADLADLKGWRIALVGDPLQFSAVGRGGMFGLLVDTFGAIELDRVRRFDNEWEREASLRLRRGDVTVAEVYEAHGRLHSGTLNQMERASVAAWWERRQAGNKGLLMSPTNEATERLNQRCQQSRIKSGEIDPDGRHITVGAYEVHIGDEIATRQNERRLITDRGEMVRNRAIWSVDHVHPDGSLTATGKNGTVRLPANYVAEHVELAYARTVIGAQGRNVQGGASFYEKPTDVRNLYVAMTRGTGINEAFMVSSGEETAVDIFAQSIATDWIDLPAHTRRAELRDEKPHRPGLLDGGPLRELLEQRHDITSALANAERDLDTKPRERRAVEAEKADAERKIAATAAALEQARAVLDRYDRPLHRRKHETEIANAKHDLVDLPLVIDDARSKVNNADATLDRIDQRVAAAAMLLRSRHGMDSTVSEIDERLDRDLHIRTRIVRLEQPESIVATIGARPTPGQSARAWDLAAAQLDQHQSAFNLDVGLGRRPALLDHGAYADSRAAVDIAILGLEPSVRHPVDVPRPELGLSL